MKKKFKISEAQIFLSFALHRLPGNCRHYVTFVLGTEIGNWRRRQILDAMP